MAREQVKSGATSVWTNKADLQLIAERVFDAPRDLVWKAWTEPERIVMWWGPRDWKTTNCQMEVSPGGVWHYCMRGPDGAESWGKAIYREIVEPERIVYYDVFSDPDGNTNEAMPGMLITIEFTEQDGKTRITSTAELASAEQLESILAMGVTEGLTQMWDQLADYLEHAS